ncbi:hypothetical protein ACIBSV_36240 [Embleya sp. NPDC050154]|uniref:hypothetical protein n=1 Tax=Embleya sp. NPDC050154 TaxID=3363988 RepID=UPI0037A19F90
MRVLSRSAPLVVLILSLSTVTAPAAPAGPPLTPWRTTEIKPGDVMVHGLAFDDAGGGVGAGRAYIRENGRVVDSVPAVLSRDRDTGMWRQSTVKTPGAGVSLRDVDLASPDSALAVGTFDPVAGGFPTAVSRKDSWDAVTAPAPPGIRSGLLADVDVVSATDAWAVGTVDYAEEGPGGSPPQQPIVEHWNGEAWTRTPLPEPKVEGWSGFGAVAAVAPDDVWVAGHAYEGQAPPLAHFGGGTWQYVPLPFEGNSLWAGVTSLLARSPQDMWALGFMQDPTAGEERPLLWHFDGRKWTQAAAPVEDMRVIKAVATPTGIAALTMHRSEGYEVYTITGDRWTRLALPKAPKGEAQWPTAIAYDNGRLTVAAAGLAESPDGSAPIRALLFSTRVQPVAAPSSPLASPVGA